MPRCESSPIRKTLEGQGTKGRTSNSPGMGKPEVQAIPDFEEPMYEIVPEVVWQVGKEIIEIHQDAKKYFLKTTRNNVLSINTVNRIEINKFKARDAFMLIGAHSKMKFDKMIENLDKNSDPTSRSGMATPTEGSNFDRKITGSETLSQAIGLNRDFRSSLGEFDGDMIDKEMASIKKLEFVSRLLKQQFSIGSTEDKPVSVKTSSQIETPSKKDNALGGMTARDNRKTNTLENTNLLGGKILEIFKEDSGMLGSRCLVGKKDKFGITSGKILLKKPSEQIVVPISEPDPVAQPEDYS